MRNLHSALLLLLGVALVHHPVLWIDHMLWDEVSFYKMAKEHDLSGKLASLADQGVATVYNFYVLFSWFPDATKSLRVAAFLSIWIIAWVLHTVLTRFGRLTAGQALGAALVTVAYPAYQMYANAGAAIYIICPALFAAGVWCYLRGMSQGAARLRWYLVASAAAWMVSFAQQWLLVFFYGFFVALFISRPLAWWRKWGEDCRDRWMLLRLHGVLLTMPLVYYFSQRWMFPLDPYYVGYSVPVFAWRKNLADTWQAVSCSLLSPLARMLLAPAWFWLAAVMAIGLVLGYRWRRRPAVGPSSSGDRGGVSAPRLVIAGVLLLAAGLFPFVIVGKPFAADGPETRFSILVAPSLAVIAAGVIAAAARIRWIALRRRLGLAGGVLLAAFALQQAQAYADWQACAIKDHAIVAALRRQTPPPGVDFFVAEGSRLEHTYARRHYDWGRILHDAWGGFDRLGVTAGDKPLISRQDYTPLGLTRETVSDFRRWMGYGNPGPPDDWCEIKIETRPDFDFREAGVWKVVGEDVLHRLHLRTQTRQDWLASFVTQVSISAPHQYPYDATRLRAARFEWTQGVRSWRPVTQPLPIADPLIAEVRADPDMAGQFSFLPLGGSGFALRCDALPVAGGPATVSLRMLFRVPSDSGGGAQRTFGATCEFFPFPGAVAPQLTLVTLPYREQPGFSRMPDLDGVEVWSTNLPSHALLQWAARAPGQVVQIRKLRTGFTPTGAD